MAWWQWMLVGLAVYVYVANGLILRSLSAEHDPVRRIGWGGFLVGWPLVIAIAPFFGLAIWASCRLDHRRRRKLREARLRVREKEANPHA